MTKVRISIAWLALLVLAATPGLAGDVALTPAVDTAETCTTAEADLGPVLKKGRCGPDYCLDVWDPVICSNGQVYSNACYAARACATGCGPLDWQTSEVVDGVKKGRCGPEYCLDVWDPVMCSDGQVYSNACYAARACATGCTPY